VADIWGFDKRMQKLAGGCQENPPNISHCQHEAFILFERVPERNSRIPLQDPSVITPKLIEK